MSLTGMDALRRRVGSIKTAIASNVFEEGGKAWVEGSFKPAAKAIVPVQSGELRDSIDGEVNFRQIRVFADKPYASFVEEGTSKQEAQPFIGPAFRQTRPTLSRYIRAVLRRRT